MYILYNIITEFLILVFTGCLGIRAVRIKRRGFGVEVCGSKVLEFRSLGSGYRIWGSRFRVQGLLQGCLGFFFQDFLGNKGFEFTLSQ
jgi:hypothetical protein